MEAHISKPHFKFQTLSMKEEGEVAVRSTTADTELAKEVSKP